jgi:hypothetical protein
MRAILAAAVGLSFATLAPPALAQQDVMAPARAGQLQCYSPNELRKTCSALAGYRLRPDGSYENRARVLLSRQPLIVMTTSSPVTVRVGAVCGPVTQQHLQAAQFTVDGAAASDDDAAYLREQVAQMPGFVANEICTTYTPEENGFRADYTVNGVRSSDSARVIWVRPDEGYTVAP